MASFESIKDKVLATAGKVADKSVSIAKVAGDKAKLVGKITKLKTEIAMEKDAAKKGYAEIGKLYYEKYKDNPEPEMAQIIEEVTLSIAKVLSKQEEVAALKKELADDYGEQVDDAADVVVEIVEEETDDEV